jgi:hypothetical protein
MPGSAEFCLSNSGPSLQKSRSPVPTVCRCPFEDAAMTGTGPWEVSKSGKLCPTPQAISVEVVRAGLSANDVEWHHAFGLHGGNAVLLLQMALNQQELLARHGHAVRVK